MTEQEFKQRTKRVALQSITLVEGLPRSTRAQILGKQLVRCATSVGANYRAACRAKSPADMMAKLAIVEEESGEALYWLELLNEAHILTEVQVAELHSEFDEILAMTVASSRTLRTKSSIQNPNPK